MGQILVLGEKESFIIKILMKKLGDAEVDAKFSPLDVNRIKELWDNVSLVTFYREKEEKLPEDIRNFILGNLDRRKIIVVGEPDEGSDVVGGIPVDKIYKILPRPLDYDLFISSVNSSASQNAGEKKQILIVDDDPNYMGLVREWLVSDYKVFMVTSGSRAIKWLAANKADLILLDYEMPVMSGPELFEELRKDEKTKDIPVFFLTGSDSKEREMSIANLNPQGYFLKTMPKDELLSQVKGFFITAT